MQPTIILDILRPDWPSLSLRSEGFLKQTTWELLLPSVFHVRHIERGQNNQRLCLQLKNANDDAFDIGGAMVLHILFMLFHFDIICRILKLQSRYHRSVTLYFQSSVRSVARHAQYLHTVYMSVLGDGNMGLDTDEQPIT